MKFQENICVIAEYDKLVVESTPDPGKTELRVSGGKIQPQSAVLISE